MRSYSRTSRFTRRTAALCFVGASAVVATLGFGQGCTAITNTTAVQCTSEAECLGLGPAFAGSYCDPTTKTCILPSADAGGVCTTNSQCAVQLNDPLSICRKSDGKCVQLDSAECPATEMFGTGADLANDDAIVIGLIEPSLIIQLGTVFDFAAYLAWTEIHTAGGIPDGNGKVRPLVVVNCREFGSGRAGMLRAANHLAQDIHVPLVIGPIDPSDTGPAAQQVFLPSKTLEILPLAFNSNLTALTLGVDQGGAPGLWRLSFDDHGASLVTSAFITNQLEPYLNTVMGVPTIKVAIVSSGDPLGISESNQMLNALTFNGMSGAANLAAVPPNLLLVNIGNFEDVVNDPNPQGPIGAALGQIFGFKPNIVIQAYTPPAISYVYFPLEGGWTAATGGAPLPFEIGANPVFNGFAPIFPFISGAPGRAGRFFSIQSYTDPAANSAPYPVAPPAGVNNDPVQPWIADFVATDRGSTLATDTVEIGSQNVWYNYDAMYMATYAIAALGNTPVTGANLAGTLTKLVNGSVPINTWDGPTSGLAAAFAALRNGQGIALTGLAGPITTAMNVTSGAVTYGLEMTCPTISPQSGQAVAMHGSGFHFVPAPGGAVGGQAQITTFVPGTGDQQSAATGTMNGCPPPFL